jgi:hypothetical protein
MSQRRSGRYEEEKNLLLLPGIEPLLLSRPARRLVVIPTELYGSGIDIELWRLSCKQIN